jgi:hypothetical protein
LVAAGRTSVSARTWRGLRSTRSCARSSRGSPTWRPPAHRSGWPRGVRGWWSAPAWPSVTFGGR